MTSHILLYMVILTCTHVAVNSRPSNESAVSEEPITLIDGNATDSNKEQRSISYLMDNQNDPDNQATRDIVEKIKAINDSLKKPYRQQINHNQYAKGDYAVDNELLEKIKHLIATSKLNTKTKVKDIQLDVTEELDTDNREIYTRDLKFVPNSINPVPVPVMHIPYTINIPVFVMPVNNQMSQKYAPTDPSQTNMYQTRQSFLQGFPSLQNFQWSSPFASLFPIIVKDPLVGYFQGGGWNNFFEYGQQADVCNRRLKAEDEKKASENELLQNIVQQLQYSNRGYRENKLENDRDSRALKINMAPETVSQQTDDSDASKTIYYQRPTVTKKTTKRPLKSQTAPPTASSIITQEDGDLRMPFSDFTLFGNRKPTIPSPGFFINKLRVRKGGVAIAGPGGVATAGNGGTAIVGAGGLAYTKPGGLAVAGPHARVVALSPDSDFSSILSKLHKQNGTYVQSSQSIREGRLVATGPTIYYHPKEQTASTQYLPFYGGGKGQYLEIKKDTVGTVLSEKIVPEEKISSEIIKNSDENLLAKVLAANLQSLRTSSGNSLNLLNLGRKKGYLSNAEKSRFKNQLNNLGEVASNTIKLIEELNIDLDSLFKKNDSRLRQSFNNNYDDDVGEEGVGIDNPTDPDGSYDDGDTIAEAKPVGLAVIAEHGLAAARPIGTAVAVSGVALARPIGTAIAGIDPSLLGIDFQVNHGKRSTNNRE